MRMYVFAETRERLQLAGLHPGFIMPVVIIHIGFHSVTIEWQDHKITTQQWQWQKHNKRGRSFYRNSFKTTFIVIAVWVTDVSLFMVNTQVSYNSLRKLK